MSIPPPGAIDCDVHPALPGTHVLLPYLDEYWREHVRMRGLERDNYDLGAYPPNAPLSGRPDWRDGGKRPGSDSELAAETFLQYKAAQAGEIDWRPTETIPEDFYAY